MRRQVPALSTILVCFSSGLIAFALAADFIGLGKPGFHALQWFLVVVGACLLLLGILAKNPIGRRWINRYLMSRPGLLLFGLVSTLIFVEGVLNLYEWIHDRWGAYEERGLLHPVADPVLGVRLPPNAEGHDARGFRNKTVPSKADIVAIGDSQTWGVNVERSEAWPQVLSKQTGRSVYNMGLGYYSPVQYWALTKEALAFSPKIIVIGFYFGNDLWGAYDIVYNAQVYSRLRKPNAEPNLFHNTLDEKLHALSTDKSNFQQAYIRANYSWLTRQLPNCLAIVRLLTTARIWPGTGGNDQYQMEKAWALHFPNDGAIYEPVRTRTIFKTSYRLLGLDLEDPRIVEGLRISKEMLAGIKSRTDARDVRLLILLIPTKESVYVDAMLRAYGSLDPMFERVVRNEQQIRSEFESYFRNHGIDYVDILPSLRQALQQQVRIYPENADDHPLQEGYRIFALAVMQAIQSRGW